MFSQITSFEIKKIIPRRSQDSHKGDNGRVLIIGGDINYYGAPILAGMGALNSGADLVYLCVPQCNFEVSRTFLPDFIVRKYSGESLNEKALPIILELAKKVDCVIIGPGISKDQKILSTIKKIITEINCPLVLDAYAIQAIKNKKFKNKKIVITPHEGELEKLMNHKVPDKLEERIKLVRRVARKNNLTLLLKGSIDIISDPKGKIIINKTGNAGMTVGGSGDVLAGLTASLIAQKMDNYSSAISSAYLLGLTGDELFKHKGYCYTATDLATNLPYIIKQFCF